MGKKILLFGLLVFTLPILLTPSSPLTLRSIHYEGIAKEQRKSGKVINFPKFEDATLTSGVWFAHRQGDEKLTGLDEVLGSGVCAFDYNNDGWIDILLINGSGESRYYGKEHWWQEAKGHQLFRNNGHGKFENVTKQSQLAANTWGMGCTTSDLDNDGDQDVVITNNGPNLIYQNNGDGTFMDVTHQTGITGDHWSTSAAISDFNSDGLLDIYITNYIRFEKRAFTYEKQNSFTNSMNLAFDSTLYDAVENTLYQNEGNLRFRNVSQEYGVENAGGRSLNSTWIDVNDDLFPDLYIVNDKGIGSNTLYINHDGNSFIEASGDSKAGSAGGHTSTSTGDINNDGNEDIFLSSGITKTHNLLINKFKKTENKKAAHSLFKDESRQRGIGTEDTSGQAGWASGIYDFNNDGWQDIYVANGLLIPEKDSPKITVGQTNELWLNNGSGNLTKKPHEPGSIFSDHESSRGAAFADFNNDGSIDVYISNNNGIGQLLLNKTEGNWLSIKLTGSTINMDAIGSKVTVTTEGNEQQKVVSSGNSFLSSSDKRLHFGLGAQQFATSVKVEWPDGTVSSYGRIKANQHILIQKEKESFQQQLITKVKHTPENEAILRLSIGEDRSANRADYVRWLPRFLALNEALPELKAALNDSSEEVRLASINALKGINHPQALSLAIEGMDDKSQTVRLAALEALCGYEDEYATRWLLRQFNSPFPLHREATAHCFEYYYREEEAVVNRKALAIPHLITLLEDKDEQVIIAAIKALAEAESYRAVSPLIMISRSKQSSEKVTTNAIRAIGLIRERSALDFILEELTNPNNTSTVHAHCMIALKRLEPSFSFDEIVKKTTTNSLIYSSNENAIEHTLSLFTNLLSIIRTESVFSTQVVANTLYKLYNENQQFFSRNTTILRNYIESIAASASQSDALTPHINNPDTQVRKLALTGLIRNTLHNRGYYIKKALCGESDELVTGFVNLMNQNNISVSESDYVELLKNDNCKHYALELTHTSPGKNALKILASIAADTKQPAADRVNALKAMIRSDEPSLTLPKPMLNTSTPEIKKLTLEYIQANTNIYPDKNEIINFYKKSAYSEDTQIAKYALQILAKTNTSWGTKIITEIITKKEKPLKLRKLALMALAENNNTQLLYNVAIDQSDPLNKVSLRLLADSKELHKYPEISELMLNNNDRFIVVKSLINAGSTEAFFSLRPTQH